MYYLDAGKRWKVARILFVAHSSHLSGATHSLLHLLRYITEEHGAAVVAPGDGALFDCLERMGIPSYHTGPHALTWRNIPLLCRLVAREGFDLIYGNKFRSA